MMGRMDLHGEDCPKCGGTGKDSRKRTRNCTYCGGSGKVSFCDNCGLEYAGVGNQEGVENGCIDTAFDQTYCEKPAKVLTHDYEDLDFFVAAKTERHRVLFDIYSVTDRDEAGTPAFPLKDCGGNYPTTTDFTKAEIHLSGHVKWDGCSNWIFTHSSIHFCCSVDAVNISKVLCACMEWAENILGYHILGPSDPMTSEDKGYHILGPSDPRTSDNNGKGG